jgi:hypothetical protein
MSAPGYRLVLTRLLTFLAGLYFVVEFLLPKIVLEKIGLADSHEAVTNGFITLTAMALGLGLINIILVHGTRLIYLRRDWPYSIVLISGMLLMGSVSFINWFNSLSSSVPQKTSTIIADFALDIQAQLNNKDHVGTLPPLKRIEILRDSTEAFITRYYDQQKKKGYESLATQLELIYDDLDNLSSDEHRSNALGLLSEHLRTFGSLLGEVLREIDRTSFIGGLYVFLLDGLFNSLASAMFSLLAVYIAAAAYRAFRIRSFESSLMMISAVLVILGQTSFGLYIWDGMPEVRQWLLEVPNAAAFRAIKIGSSVAALVLAFRMWLSIESDSFSAKE